MQWSAPPVRWGYLAVSDPNPNLIIPVGTQVVTDVAIKSSNGDVAFARGVVGIVIRAPAHNIDAYKVRFMGGSEVSLKRNELTIRSHFTAPSQSAVDLFFLAWWVWLDLGAQIIQIKLEALLGGVHFLDRRLLQNEIL